jgi:hypothetical protein
MGLFRRCHECVSGDVALADDFLSMHLQMVANRQRLGMVQTYRGRLFIMFNSTALCLLLLGWLIRGRACLGTGYEHPTTRRDCDSMHGYSRCMRVKVRCSGHKEEDSCE